MNDKLICRWECEFPNVRKELRTIRRWLLILTIVVASDLGLERIVSLVVPAVSADMSAMVAGD